MNIAICAVILKAYAAPYLEQLNQMEPMDAFWSLHNAASDENNEEVIAILNWIQSKGLISTFFR